MGNYHLIKKCSISDGIGCRVAVYLSGCKWHCKNCHNPMTWDKDSGKPFTEETLREIYNALNHSHINGVTLTGGDPLNEANLDNVRSIIDMVHSNTFAGGYKDIWLYTGYEYDNIKALKEDHDQERLDIIKDLDVLVDGPFIEELRDVTYRYAGSTNQKVIDIKRMKLFDMDEYCMRSDKDGKSN